MKTVMKSEERTHWQGMTITLLLMLTLLVLMLGVRPAHAQTVEASQPTRQQILERLSALEAEIAQLKATLQGTAPPASPRTVDPP